MPPYTAHLLVVCHGLWGTRSHIAYICKSAQKYANLPTAPRSQSRSSSPTRKDVKEEDVRLVVLPASLNEWTHTYDGIDICAERVVQEIDEECKRIEEDGGQVKRFSIVGYSLGGLVARYVLGLLESRTPSFFEEVRPVNFATFCSPAIGIPRYDSFWSVVIRFLGARLLSRSGAQLYENDRFLPSSLLDGNNQLKKKGFMSHVSFQKEKAEPLLAVMADPRYSFFKALSAFERVEIFANSVNDRTVPMPTGAIEAHDPFSQARAKAMKAAAARGEEDDYDPDIREGGLEITLEKGSALIASYKPCEPLVPERQTSTGPPPKKRFRVRLPLLLRPATYPFSRPVSIFIIVFLPITLPASLLYLVGRFVLQGRYSKRRIRDIRKDMGGGREGMLERVGVKLRAAIDEVTENVQPDNPELAVETSGWTSSLQESTPSTSSTTSTGDEAAPILRHPSMAPFTSYSGTETPPLSRPLAPDLMSNPSMNKPIPTDPVLSDAQKEMIKNLNSIPQMRKHLAYFPKSRNAHGTLIARDLSYEQHHQGKYVVDAWAKEFRV